MDQTCCLQVAGVLCVSREQISQSRSSWYAPFFPVDTEIVWSDGPLYSTGRKRAPETTIVFIYNTSLELL